MSIIQELIPLREVALKPRQYLLKFVYSLSAASAVVASAAVVSASAASSAPEVDSVAAVPFREINCEFVPDHTFWFCVKVSIQHGVQLILLYLCQVLAAA